MTNKPTATQAERDYVADLHEAVGDLMASDYVRQGKADGEVRTSIDYVRKNPLPEQGK